MAALSDVATATNQSRQTGLLVDLGNDPSAFLAGIGVDDLAASIVSF